VCQACKDLRFNNKSQSAAVATVGCSQVSTAQCVPRVAAGMHRFNRAPHWPGVRCCGTTLARCALLWHHGSQSKFLPWRHSLVQSMHDHSCRVNVGCYLPMLKQIYACRWSQRSHFHAMPGFILRV
jgi:hypothetical protein